MSPARLDPGRLSWRVAEGRMPRLVLVDQSPRDQLVPMVQRDRLLERLAQVDGLRVAVGHRCTGRHSEPWQTGVALWQSVQDAVAALG